MASELALLKSMTFGSQVAEREQADLESYFVETSQWQRMAAGEIDIVYGPKGSGKSAIYSLMMRRAERFSKSNIAIVLAENPQGAAVFAALQRDPPEPDEFIGMWKLYFALILADALVKEKISNSATRMLISLLESAGLRRREPSLTLLLRTVLDYLKRIRVKPSIEFVATGPKFGAEISLTEPTTEERDRGFLSVDQLLHLASDAWTASKRSAWILLDRLDVSFEGTPDLEITALRALFKTYLDLAGLKGVQLKVFLRSDIWQRLAAGGFREASHITRYTTIIWDKSSLLSLIVRRMFQNDEFRRFYGVSGKSIAWPYEEQVRSFDLAFSTGGSQVRKLEALDWIIKHTSDGTGNTTPRDIIHLLNEARLCQIKALELTGKAHCQPLIGRDSFREALPEISKFRLENTVYAEYPSVESFIRQLERQKSGQTLESLSRIWSVPFEDCRLIAGTLVEIGFFQQERSTSAPRYRVPLIYREALRISARAEPEFGEHVLKLRLKEGLSQEDLAEAAGLSVESIMRIENGTEGLTRREQIAAIEGALKASKFIRMEKAIIERDQLSPKSIPAQHKFRRPTLRTNLPSQMTAFIGRESELQEIGSLLRHDRLVTITGMGGVGKTRLALQAARDELESYSDGVWFVELAALTEGSFVVRAIGSALSMRTAATFEAVVNHLKLLNLLLILDNCEHVIQELRSVAAAICRECPQVTILATSREDLGIGGERSYRLSSLSVPPDGAALTALEAVRYDAIRLFNHRAREADRQFTLTDENALIIIDICRRLDGIPLAIELAAARLKMLSPKQLRERLDDNFRVLTGGSRNALPRQQTLRALLNWSYDLLSPEEQKVLLALASLADWWTLDDAALALADAGMGTLEVFEAVASLVDKSLILTKSDGDIVRYGMAMSTRSFAIEKLVASRANSEQPE
jgi:predicted ATPase/DNA-binding XRE family transcriptional regulator